ncbi:hypothetical protein ACFY1B_03375 [Streptomyces mirabilis]|jgi:hypothetical protein|uniref:hypothetical protein n=1 Tax=Streptomyces mirabilis TaxID=68239 RepID=UPI0036CE8BE4
MPEPLAAGGGGLDVAGLREGGRRARDEPCGVGDSEDDGRGVDGQASTVRPGQRDEHDAEDRRQQDDHVGRPFHRPAERGTQPSS